MSIARQYAAQGVEYGLLVIDRQQVGHTSHLPQVPRGPPVESHPHQQPNNRRAVAFCLDLEKSYARCLTSKRDDLHVQGVACRCHGIKIIHIVSARPGGIRIRPAVIVWLWGPCVHDLLAALAPTRLKTDFDFATCHHAAVRTPRRTCQARKRDQGAQKRPHNAPCPPCRCLWPNHPRATSLTHLFSYPRSSQTTPASPSRRPARQRRRAAPSAGARP